MQWRATDKLWKGEHADDDAIVVRLPNGGLVATTVDVITPLVDDPYVFGQLAAANSMSDVYAMGGTPIFAMSILGFPGDKISTDTAAKILQGAVDKAGEVGVVMAGGHTIASSDVLFGLAVVGTVEELQILQKEGVQAGDVLVLTKPLGSGLLGAALKRRLLDPATLAEWSEWMCRLNSTACQAALAGKAHAATDITGFGLLGHLWEMVQRSGVKARLLADAVPTYPLAAQFATMGLAPGGTRRNLKHVGPNVRFSDQISETQKLILADAQTSGGLLVALSEAGLHIFDEFCKLKNQPYWVIGYAEAGSPEIDVR